MSTSRFNITLPARVVVDPNGAARGDASLSVALLEDADRIPKVGELVFAVQPEDDEPDYISSAIVKEIDHAKGLIYLAVDWAGFHEAPQRRGFVVRQRRMQGSRIAWKQSYTIPTLESQFTSRNGNITSDRVLVA